MKNYSASIFFGEDHDHAAHIRFSFGDSNFGDSQMPEDINIEISHVVWEGPDAEEQFGHLNLGQPRQLGFFRHRLFNLIASKMTTKEIKDAVDAGQNVYWENLAYQVIKMKGDYYIKMGSHLIGLTWEDGKTLNGKPEDFFIK